jgi:predicted O-linked N-acetylglucosamine transferase (SPINDLY family)
MSGRLQKAQHAMQCGDFDQVEKLCRSSIKLGKDVVASRQLLATCLYNKSTTLLGHPDLLLEAEKLLRECLKLVPDFRLALQNLGSLLLITNRPQQAADVLRDLSRLPNPDIRVLETLATAQQESGDLEGASVTLQRLFCLNPANGAAYLIRDALLIPAVAASSNEVHRIRRRALEKLQQLSLRDDLHLSDPLGFPSTYFRFTYHGESNVDLNRLVAKVYAKADPQLQWEAPHVRSWKVPSDRKIRIGVASRFLRSHSIGNTSRGFVEMLDRSKFEDRKSVV